MNTKVCLLALVGFALLTAGYIAPVAAQTSLEERFSRLEATVKRHDSQLTDLNTKVDSTDEKLTKLLQITEAMASRQLNAGDAPQIADRKQVKATPVSLRQAGEELNPRQSADLSRRNDRKNHRFAGPGIVIVITGYRYHDDPFGGDDWSDPFDNDYDATDFDHVACR